MMRPRLLLQGFSRDRAPALDTGRGRRRSYSARRSRSSRAWRRETSTVLPPLSVRS